MAYWARRADYIEYGTRGALAALVGFGAFLTSQVAGGLLGVDLADPRNTPAAAVAGLWVLGCLAATWWATRPADNPPSPRRAHPH